MIDNNEFLDAISPERMWKHLENLAGIDRTSGTEGEFRAVEYLAAELDKYGIAYNVHEYDGYLSYPISAAVEIVSWGNKKMPAKTRSFSASTPVGGVEGELIYVEGGKDFYTDTETKKRLNQIDLCGKIVLSEGGSRENMILAQKRGALGYIHMWPSDEEYIHESIVTPVWGTPTPEKLEDIPQIPVLSVNNKDGMSLKEALEKETIKVRLFTLTETKWNKQILLEANIPGQTDDFILIAGHLDSWHLGATDNATGNAVCLELARVFHKYKDQLKRGVRIAWWPGHSTGRYGGSTWYCDNFWFDLHEHCLAYINIDSPGPLGATDYSEITAVAETADLALSAVKDVTGQKAKWERPVRAADQSFWGPGVSSVYLLLSNRPPHQRARVGGSGYGWWWHTEEDTLDKADKGVLLTDARIYGLTAFRVCTELLLPLNMHKAVKELQDIVAELEKKNEMLFDLKPVSDSLCKLDKTTQIFMEKAEHSSEEETEKFNKHLSAALKYLTQINYTEVGAFEHDPAIPSYPLPSLKDISKLAGLKGNPDIGFVLTKLVRSRNKVIYNINCALKELEAALLL